MLQVSQLSFDYAASPVLSEINFTVLPGQILHLKGHNGAGKTTLLKLIAGLLTPSAGRIYFEGQPIENALKAYQRQLCFIGHKPGISPALTLRENCQYDLHGVGEGYHWRDGVESFSLNGLENIPCGLLSAGQRRRVALLRLIRSKAKLWLLDEPLVALDSQTIVYLTQQLLAHIAKGGTIILTSHQSLSLYIDNYWEYVL